MFCSTTVRACRYGECVRGRTNADRLNRLRKKCNKTRKKLPSGGPSFLRVN